MSKQLNIIDLFNPNNEVLINSDGTIGAGSYYVHAVLDPKILEHAMMHSILMTSQIHQKMSEPGSSYEQKNTLDPREKAILSTSFIYIDPRNPSNNQTGTWTGVGFILKISDPKKSILGFSNHDFGTCNAIPDFVIERFQSHSYFENPICGRDSLNECVINQWDPKNRKVVPTVEPIGVFYKCTPDGSLPMNDNEYKLADILSYKYNLPLVKIPANIEMTKDYDFKFFPSEDRPTFLVQKNSVIYSFDLRKIPVFKKSYYNRYDDFNECDYIFFKDRITSLDFEVAKFISPYLDESWSIFKDTRKRNVTKEEEEFTNELRSNLLNFKEIDGMEYSNHQSNRM